MTRVSDYPVEREKALLAERRAIAASVQRWYLLWSRLGRILLLGVSDWLGVAVSGALAYYFWAFLVRDQSALVYVEIAPLSLLFLVAYAKWGLYPGFGLGAPEQLRRLFLASAFIYLVLAGFIYAFRIPHHYSRASFVIAFVLTLVLVPLFRFALLAMVRSSSWWKEPAVIIGTGPLAQRVSELLNTSLSLGYRPVGYVESTAPPVSSERKEREGLSVLGPLSSIEELAASGIRVAMIADEALRKSSRQLSIIQERFRHVISVPEDQDLPVEAAQVCNLGGLLGVEFVNQLLRQRNRALKRALDIVGSALGLIVAAPVLALAALAVKVSSRGPALFWQEREGLAGRRVLVPKIRTMYVDSQRRLEELLREDPRAREEWNEQYKLRNDPRIIPMVGHFLRRFSIDELPQLWSVLVGEMSLVGPRPFPDYHLSAFPPEFRRLRRRVRPGLTGLWQVMVRNEGGLEEQTFYDTYYIKNWSVWQDVYIVARTIGKVLQGKGAH